MLLLLMAGEVVVVTARYERPTLSASLSGQALLGPARLFEAAPEVWRLSLWVVGACLILLSPRTLFWLDALRSHSRAHRWRLWLLGHLAMLAGLLMLTEYTFVEPADLKELSQATFVAWLFTAGITLLSWLGAFAPGRFWLQLIRQEGWVLAAGVLLGVGAWTLLGMLVRQDAPLAQRGLWATLSGLTLAIVHGLLALGYSDIVYDPETLAVGTGSFWVRVSYACSGIEGVSLIIVFLSIYVWLFRKELRFPQAFWLYPFGILAIWLSNAVRVAALIVIGTDYAPEVALGAFHSEAGWVTFTVVAVGAIVLSHLSGIFVRTEQTAPDVPRDESLASALLVPLMVIIAVSMVTGAFSTGFDRFYAARVLAVAGALWWFRDRYAGLGWSCSWQAVAMGGLVFGIWILLEPLVGPKELAPALGFSALPAWVAGGWVLFRVVGAIAAVPLAEELVFRGYLLRKLVADDYERVSFRRFTWFSFIGSSFAFGLLHGDRWIQATLAGMGFAAALYRRGQLGDAVAAHATTNALICVWVLLFGHWEFWS